MEQLSSDAPAVSVMHFSTSFFKNFIRFLAGNGPGACRPFIIVLFPCPILLFSDSLQLPFGILHRNAIFLACEHALAHTYKTTTMRMLIRCILFVRVASLCVAATFLYYFRGENVEPDDTIFRSGKPGLRKTVCIC